MDTTYVDGDEAIGVLQVRRTSRVPVPPWRGAAVVRRESDTRAMAILRVCSRCGALHKGRGRCRGCRRRSEDEISGGTHGRLDARDHARIRRMMLIREERCLLCGTAEDLRVCALPGVGASKSPSDYAVFCSLCAPEAADGQAA